MSKENIEFTYVESLKKWQCRINYPNVNPTYYGHGKDKKEAELKCREEIKKGYY